MTEPRTHNARARVTLVLEIDVGDTWGADCSVKQVHDQAGETAIGMIRQWLDKDPSVRQRVRIVNMPKIEAIVVTREAAP